MIVGVAGGSVWLLVLLLLIELGLFITMSVLWFRSMHRAMAACHPVSRSADPDSVWLNFIPVFGLVWIFICTSRISDSLAREYHRRGWHSDENRPALELGIVAGVVICICVLIRSIFALHPGIGFVMTLAMCFCMYRHMDRLNSFRERLEKELDPTTAFGQIPVMQQMVATAFHSKQPLPVTQETLAEQLRSAYTNIPFVPQTPFAPESMNVPPPKNESDMTEYTPYLPPENTTEQIPDTTDNANRWAPPQKP
jgi:hypothetical protein